MDQLIRQLARERIIQAEYKAEYDDLRAEMQEEYKVRMDRVTGLLSVANADAQDTEREIRRVALVKFESSENRHPHKAVQVKSYTVLGYDSEDAFRYCVQHLTAALNMNKRKFEQVAKVVGLDFVTIGTEPRATIARDLSGYLDAETEGDGHD